MDNLVSLEKCADVSFLGEKIVQSLKYVLLNRSSNSSCRKPYFQLVFMGREKFHAMERSNMSGTCRWLNGCRREKRICTKHKELSKVLWNARKLAVKYCESQFR